MTDTYTHAPGMPVQVRMDEQLLTALEEWRRSQKTIPSRPAAIRRLVARALADTVAA
jgi:Ribbon-helix-helix protein, copG family